MLARTAIHRVVYYDLDPANPDDRTVRAARVLARPGVLDGCERQAREGVVEALRDLEFRAATRVAALS